MRASRLLDDLRLGWAVAGGIAANFYRDGALSSGAMDIMLVAAVADMAHVAAEDVIILKMIANRYKDLADVESILEAHVKLDRAYLDDWLAQWGVTERFRAVEDRVAEHRAELGRPSRQSTPHCR